MRRGVVAISSTKPCLFRGLLWLSVRMALGLLSMKMRQGSISHRWKRDRNWSHYAAIQIILLLLPLVQMEG